MESVWAGKGEGRLGAVRVKESSAEPGSPVTEIGVPWVSHGIRVVPRKFFYAPEHLFRGFFDPSGASRQLPFQGSHYWSLP